MQTAQVTLATSSATAAPTFGEHILAPTSGKRFFELQPAPFFCSPRSAKELPRQGPSKGWAITVAPHKSARTVILIMFITSLF